MARDLLHPHERVLDCATDKPVHWTYITRHGPATHKRGIQQKSGWCTEWELDDISLKFTCRPVYYTGISALLSVVCIEQRLFQVTRPAYLLTGECRYWQETLSPHPIATLLRLIWWDFPLKVNKTLCWRQLQVKGVRNVLLFCIPICQIYMRNKYLTDI